MKNFLFLLLALVSIGTGFNLTAQDRYCRPIVSDCQYQLDGKADYWFMQGEWVEVEGKSNGNIIVEGKHLPTDNLKIDKHYYTDSSKKKILSDSESAIGAENIEWYDQKSQNIKVNNKTGQKTPDSEKYDSTCFRLRAMPMGTDSISVYNLETRELVCVLKDTTTIHTIDQSIKSLKLIPNNRVSSVLSESIKQCKVETTVMDVTPEDTITEILLRNWYWILLGLVVIILIVLLLIFKPWKKEPVINNNGRGSGNGGGSIGSGTGIYVDDPSSSEINRLKQEVSRLNQTVWTREKEIKDRDDKIYRINAELIRTRSERDNAQRIAQDNVKPQIEEGIRTAKEDAKKRIEKAENDARKRVDEAETRARTADEKADKKVAEARAQAKTQVEKAQNEANAKVNRAQAEATSKVEKAQADAKAQVAQAKSDAEKDVAAEKQRCESKLADMRKDMECYTRYLVSVRPALEYTKTVNELLELMKQMKAAAFELLENDAVEDPYYIYKAISKYEKNLENLDESKLLTDIKLLLDTNFVLTSSQLSQFDQDKGFDDSMRQYYFNYYLEKIFNAVVVFNETLIGIQYFIDGLDTSLFVKYREEIRNLAEKLSIDYAVLEIHSGLKVSEDIKIREMVDAGWSDPGLVVEVENCIVYMRGANRPETKIYIKVQE